MANLEHKDIPDEELHEPKGAADAASETYLKANGDGTTEWVALELPASDQGLLVSDVFTDLTGISSVVFTDIPDTVQEIYINFVAVVGGAGIRPYIRFGLGAAPATTGYQSYSIDFTAARTRTDGIWPVPRALTNYNEFTASVCFVKSGDYWVVSGGWSDAVEGITYSGRFDTGGIAVDRVQILSDGGSLTSGFTQIKYR